jgi:polysaccharide biosynthesis protein PslG
MRMAREGGFSHAKMVIHWPNLEPEPGRYRWRETEQNDLDNVMRAARAEGMRLVVRVDGVPAWAGGAPANADLAAVARLYQAMAAHGRGTVVGYEILNEPNLPFEWGGPPSAAGYTAFLRAAYRGVKRADPAAVVIGGGPSPGTGGLGGTIEDVDFLRGMYAAGARGAMDALGVHPYGGNLEPEADPTTCTICFRRAEAYRRVMLEAGDAATPAWATEFGWLIDSGTDLGQYEWMKVSAEQQADYLVRAFRYARANWPWLRGTLVSNLDASTSPYHTGPQDGMPWFALLDADYAPRPAYAALQAHIRTAGSSELAAAPGR